MERPFINKSLIRGELMIHELCNKCSNQNCEWQIFPEMRAKIAKGYVTGFTTSPRPTNESALLLLRDW